MPDPPVYVRESGTGPRTVVLLHGFSDHGGTWCRVEPALAERYRVLVVDLPGFGRSAGHWNAPVLDHYVDVLADLVADTPEPVSLIGNSLGAVASLMFASTAPGRVEKVVLADMPGLAGIPRSWVGGARVPLGITRALSRPVPAPVMRRTIGALYARAAVHQPRHMNRAVRAAFTANFADRWQIDTLLAVGSNVIGELARLPIREMVHALDMPALLLWGAHDRITPAQAARRVAPGLHRRVVIIPEAGHCPQLDAPSEFLDAVLPFLDRGIDPQRARSRGLPPQ
ncbi:alpha/beta fold hydrolase [Rhodococcus chondri]|uniref:Alpha/beta hydrolase n=1 Tax=Rhodococcus chondri TaxID=3065941 RepID=A0ABU7JYB9_9NOCA|nr:alpha/beta hydrolase [Rhodococcus sp. CC-R104]MEE2035013.1 alpha/beta hydrolase [Rhodococcus sp. CC-R104]